jgi:hypothetical protein
MDYLFDSVGTHIANRVGGQLHAPTGPNVGHWRENEKIFIGMNGRYLGEIVARDRLLFRTNSPYLSTNFGIYGNYGNAGNCGDPGRRGSVGTVAGFTDVEAPWL